MSSAGTIHRQQNTGNSLNRSRRLISARLNSGSSLIHVELKNVGLANVVSNEDIDE